MNNQGVEESDKNSTPKNDLNNSCYEKSLSQLIHWTKSQDYSGWDPYDGLSGEFAVKFKKNLPISSMFLQLNLYSPVNIRKILGTPKNRSNKGIALIARAYLILYDITQREEFRVEATKLLEHLENNSVKYKGNIAWHGNKFDYVSVGHISDPTIPTVVGTTEAIKTFLKAYESLGDHHYIEVVESSLTFIEKELLSQKNGYKYVKYYPSEDNKLVVNVSALTLETFSKYLQEHPREDLLQICRELSHTITKLQAADGRWPYSYYFKNRFFYNQTDYHQGFILDGLTSYLSIADKERRKTMLEAIEKGASFYRHRQFTDDGYSYYRFPIKYPIDIHNQAQGIITFTKLAQIQEKYRGFPERILSWTIKNMQSGEGYFFTHRWPILVNQIPYMRWGQAWMMLSMATYLSYTIRNRETK